MTRRLPLALLAISGSAWLAFAYPFMTCPEVPDRNELHSFPRVVLDLAAVRYAPVPNVGEGGLREEAFELRLMSLTAARRESQRVIFDRPSTTLAGYLVPDPASWRSDQRPLASAAQVFWLAARLEEQFGEDEILALILSTSREPAALRELSDPRTPLSRIAALLVDPIEDAATLNRADAVLVLAGRTGRFDEGMLETARAEIANATATRDAVRQIR